MLVSSSTDIFVILVWSAKLQQKRLRHIALGALRDELRLAKIAMIEILEDLLVLSTPISAMSVLVVSLRKLVPPQHAMLVPKADGEVKLRQQVSAPAYPAKRENGARTLPQRINCHAKIAE